MVNLNSFDLNLLRALEALLAEGQVSAAARRLHLSQPATSAALGRLRAALGDPLLVRDGRQMVRTAFAIELSPRVTRLLSDIETALASPKAFDPGTTKRSFRVAANDYAAQTVVAPLAQCLQHGAPRAMLEVLPLEDNFEERILAGDYDIAIRDEWSLKTARYCETLFHEDYVGIARRDHPRLSASPTLDEFLAEGHVLIAPHGRTLGPVDAALDRLHRKRHIAVTLPHFLAAPAIIAKTDCVMTIARRVAEQFAARSALRIFDVPLPLSGFSVAMAWHPKSVADPAVEWLKNTVRSLNKATDAS